MHGFLYPIIERIGFHRSKMLFNRLPLIFINKMIFPWTRWCFYLHSNRFLISSSIFHVKGFQTMRIRCKLACKPNWNIQTKWNTIRIDCTLVERSLGVRPRHGKYVCGQEVSYYVQWISFVEDGQQIHTRMGRKPIVGGIVYYERCQLHIWNAINNNQVFEFGINYIGEYSTCWPSRQRRRHELCG